MPLINGKRFYYWGEYDRKADVEPKAERERAKGHKARIVRRSSGVGGYMLYVDYRKP